MKKSCYPFALIAVAVLGVLKPADSFQPIRPAKNLIDTKSTALFGKKDKRKGGSGGKPRGQQQQQEKQSVKGTKLF